MDCRTFRKQHVAFVDDTLPAIDIVAMQRHMLECEACTHHDTTIRRSLLLVRNMPPIELSPDFRERLNARLREIGPIDYAALPEPRRGAVVPGTWMAAAAGLVVAGYLATHVLDTTAPMLSLPPVVAMQPEPAPVPLTTPAFVASVSTGMPLWSAVLMAEQVPVHFVNAQFQNGR